MKISVIGAGRVGSTTLYTLLLEGGIAEMVIVDVEKLRAKAEALDLRHALALTSNCRIVAGDYDATEGSDMVIVTAGVPRKPGETRLDLLKANVELMKGVLESILKYNRETMIFMISNPVDVLTYQALKTSGFPPNKVFGLGTVLDTSRFRSLLGEMLGVSPDQVMGYIIGEHGESMVPVISSVQVAGIPLRSFPGFSQQLLDDAIVATRFGAADVIKGKGGTYYAVAPSITSVVRAVRDDLKQVMPISSLIDGAYKDLNGMAISLPCIVGKGGREAVIDPQLSPDEDRQFRESFRLLKEAAISVGL